MQAGYCFGYSVCGQLEAEVSAQQSEINALQAGIVDVYTAHAQGAVAPFAVDSGVVVRVDVPALVANDLFPSDGEWVVSGGLIVYSGELAGLYEVHCPASFSTSIGAATLYTWEVVEGTDLATVPVRRDIVRGATEKQLTISETIVNPTGFLRLQETGGEIGIFVFHDSGSNATLESSNLSLALHRVRNP